MSVTVTSRFLRPRFYCTRRQRRRPAAVAQVQIDHAGRLTAAVRVQLGVVRQHVGALPLGGQSLGSRAQDAHASHDERRHDGDGDADGDRPRDETDRDRVERRRRRRQLRLLVDRLRRGRVEVGPQRYNEHAPLRHGLHTEASVSLEFCGGTQRQVQKACLGPGVGTSTEMSWDRRKKEFFA